MEAILITPTAQNLWNVSRKVILLSALLSAAAFAQDKKRVAVMNFEYGTVGKGIADMLVDRLVNDARYSVIERKVLDKLIAEQNFSTSDRADPSSAARLGKLLGVDAIIIGSITQFGRNDKSTNVGAGGFGAMGRFGLGGVRSKESKGVVQITARMVNVPGGWSGCRCRRRAPDPERGHGLRRQGGGHVDGFASRPRD